jgi:aminopeptidase N
LSESLFEAGAGCARDSLAPNPQGHALPGDRPRWPRDRVAAIRHVALDVTLDVPAKSVQGTVTHHLEPLNEGLREVSFDAVDMEIQGARVDGAPARWTYDGNAVRVPIGARRHRSEAIEVAIEYRATPRIGLYFVGPDDAYPDKPVQAWSQGQDEDSRYWFPCYDALNSKQTSEIRVTVPGNWTTLSNGRLAADQANGDGTHTFHWVQERPHATYLVTLVAGEFARVDASRDGLPIDYLVEPRDAERALQTFGNTPRMIELFERVTGVAYPWAKYSQVVVRDFVFGGMENTSATTMTENILLDAKAARDTTSDDLISHELAHMWFGDLLTCRDWSHGWLNESFATYLELLWREEHRGIDEYRQGVLENTQRYMEERYRRPIVSNVYNEPIDIFDRHLYEKGSIVLHMLRGLLGDDAFFRSLRRYTADHQDRNVVTQDLIDAIDAETGRNLEWFFDQWVFKPGHPEFKVSWSWDEEAKLATVNVKQTQKTDEGVPVFRAPLTIDFTVGRARPRPFPVEIREAEHTFVFPLPQKPDLCRFDPHNFVLKKLDFDKSAGELRLQLRDDDDISGRVLAAEALGKKGGLEAVAALEEAVANGRSWAVQAAAARALGAVRTEAARDALLRHLGVRHLKARRAVVAALGEFRGDEAVLAALEPRARRDQSWYVEGEANKSAGRLRLPGSLDVIRANFGRRSFREAVRIGCVDGLVELRDERGFGLLLEAARYGEPWQARGPAVGGLGRLGELFPERRKQTGNEIEPFLRDPDFRVRVAAANALKTLGEPSFAPALDDMASRELDGRGIRVAREAALALRKGAETAEEVKNLREQFEQLREENAKLRGRLDRLEARDPK